MDIKHFRYIYKKSSSVIQPFSLTPKPQCSGTDCLMYGGNLTFGYTIMGGVVSLSAENVNITDNENFAIALSTKYILCTPFGATIVSVFEHNKKFRYY